MKLINQSFERLEQSDYSIVGIYKFIERCARVSYKSEDRITEDSYKRFVQNLIDRRHERPLEFGTVHLKMSVDKFIKFAEALMIEGHWNSIWIQYKCADNLAYITTNYRYYLELEGYYYLYYDTTLSDYLSTEDNNFYPQRYTYRMILSRGVMDEFRTHVGLSHLGESTRFCNYSKGKFNTEITFIKPNWYSSIGEYDWADGMNNFQIAYPTEETSDSYFKAYLANCENTYMKLIESGCTPQQAREVLPLSVKSELISCGFEDAWSNFFWRRCASDAHPMAREIALKMRDDFEKL